MIDRKYFPLRICTTRKIRGQTSWYSWTLTARFPSPTSETADSTPLPSAGSSFIPIDDLHSFDPATMTWTLLSAANDTRRPSARAEHGFTSAGGLLYVHGGRPMTEGDADAVGRG